MHTHPTQDLKLKQLVVYFPVTSVVLSPRKIIQKVKREFSPDVTNVMMSTQEPHKQLSVIILKGSVVRRSFVQGASVQGCLFKKCVFKGCLFKGCLFREFCPGSVVQGVLFGGCYSGSVVQKCSWIFQSISKNSPRFFKIDNDFSKMFQEFSKFSTFLKVFF